MRQFLKQVFFPLVSTLFLLGFIELLSARILHSKYNRAFEHSIIQDNKFYSSSGLRENATAVVWGKAFHTDKFGFRATGKLFDKRKKTWLFIGDSVTQGVGVEDSTCYVSLLAATIDSVNVLNCSMIGWSVQDYLNVVSFLLSDSSSSLNIERITIGWCMNDVYGANSSSQLPDVSKLGKIGVVSGWLQKNASTYKLIKLLITQNSSHYYDYDMQFYTNNHPQLIAAKNTLKQIRKQCEEHAVLLDVIAFPYRSALSGQSPYQYFHQEGLIDLKDDISNCKNELADKDLYLFSDEIHFSSLGHHIIASIIVSNNYKR